LGDSSTSRSSTDGLDQILYDQPSDWEVVEAVKKVAAERGESPARVALAWLLSKPAVTAPIVGATKLTHAPIVGATKLTHLDDAIAAAEIELSADEVTMLEAPYRAHPVKGLEAPRS
jgi:aryl-alcohol dehydrogenase-like predicted oxidoreductase